MQQAHEDWSGVVDEEDRKKAIAYEWDGVHPKAIEGWAAQRARMKEIDRRAKRDARIWECVAIASWTAAVVVSVWWLW